MPSLYNEITKNLQEQEELFEMANLHPIDTGLPSKLYATFDGKSTYPQHGPRVKVETTRGLLPIVIDKTIHLYRNLKLKNEDQQKVDKAIEYITAHRQTFIDHWNGLITDRGLNDELFNGVKAKRIKSKQKVGA